MGTNVAFGIYKEDREKEIVGMKRRSNLALIATTVVVLLIATLIRGAKRTRVLLEDAVLSCERDNVSDQGTLCRIVSSVNQLDMHR